MNSENNKTNYDMFILHDEQPRAHQNKIYTVKYFSLMLTLIITACAQKFENEKLVKNTTYYYICYIIYIAAFGISCFSSFIGHRKLYFFSYSSLIVFYVLVLFNYQIEHYWIIQLVLRALRFILYLQIPIQIYGTWPQQFQRIFVEFYFSTQLALLLLIIFDSKNIFIYILITLNVINFVLIVKSINNFKSPETDSVFRDFSKLLFNKKPLIFTIIIGISELLRLLLKKVIIKQRTDIEFQVLYLAVTVIIIFILIAFQSKLRYTDYQPTLIIFISLILVSLVGLVLVILIYFKLESISFFLLFFIIIVYLIQFIYTIPQYQQILLNIGVRNLDFASSYSLLTFGIIQISTGIFLSDENFIQIKDNIQIIILILMGIIFFFSVIFYLLLGFYQYFKKSNRQQVEENEFLIQVV